MISEHVDIGNFITLRAKKPHNFRIYRIELNAFAEHKSHVLVNARHSEKQAQQLIRFQQHSRSERAKPHYYKGFVGCCYSYKLRSMSVYLTSSLIED